VKPEPKRYKDFVNNTILVQRNVMHVERYRNVKIIMCVVAQNIENFLKYDFKGFSLKYRVFFIQPSRKTIPLGC